MKKIELTDLEQSFLVFRLNDLISIYKNRIKKDRRGSVNLAITELDLSYAEGIRNRIIK